MEVNKNCGAAITVGDFRGWVEKGVSMENYTVVHLLANLEWKK